MLLRTSSARKSWKERKRRKLLVFKYSIDEIVKEAKRKGYFAAEDYPGLKLSLAELRKLGSKLGRIPRKRPEEVIEKTMAVRAVNALRKGTVLAESVTAYSAGREKLLEAFKKDLTEVSRRRSLVRFVNADLGEGKTHALSLLREIAFRMDFPVSLVTLSQSECPLHDFLLVYNKVMWSIRTSEERQRPALENIFQRWLDMPRCRGEHQAADLVRHLRGQNNALRENVVNALAAYCNATSIISPDKERQHVILDWFSGRRVYASDLRKASIHSQISEHSALEMLSILADLFRHLGYKGMCILFDEAEAIHSFSHYSQRDRAYANLLNITRAAEKYPNCYFLYSTTPSFFDNYSGYWVSEYKIRPEHIYELERLPGDELKTLGERIITIYCTAYGWKKPIGVDASVSKLAQAGKDQRIGDFVRGVIAFLDERSGRAT